MTEERGARKKRHTAKKVKKPTQTRGVYWTTGRHLLRRLPWPWDPNERMGEKS
jgi:hypothetical protein